VDFNTGCVFNVTEGFDSFCTNHQLIGHRRSDFSLRSSVFWGKNLWYFSTTSFVNVLLAVCVTFVGKIAESLAGRASSSALAVACLRGVFLKPKLL